MFSTDAGTRRQMNLIKAIDGKVPLCVAAIGSRRVAGPVASMVHQTPSRLTLGARVKNLTTAQEISQFINGKRAGMARDADICFVEISRAECIRHNDRFLSHAETKTRFRDILNSAQRQREYFAALNTGNQRDVVNLLRSWGADGTDDFASLCALSLSTATEASLEEDLTHIAGALPNPVFVTNLAATRLDGPPLRARRNFSALLAKVLRRLDLAYFDPSPFVDAIGPEATLAQEGRSLSGYAPEFEKYLAAKWIDQFLPQILEGEPLRRPVLPPKRTVPNGRRVLFAPLQNAVA